MNLNPIKQIYKFNQEAGLLDAGYSDERECAFPIEEALEGFNLTELPIDKFENTTPKGVSREIMEHLANQDDLSDVDRLDKHIDIIIYSFGSIFKLGLTPQEAIKAIGIVATANMKKLTVGVDEKGKQMKPKGFISPEDELQKLLDNR